MIEYYIVSYVILPHGITDLTRCKFKKIPLLLVTYHLSFLICLYFRNLFGYGHLVIFLLCSIVHFSEDLKYIDIPVPLSIYMSTMIVGIPLLLFYYNIVWLAKLFILSYMVSFHVPLHYTKIKLQRKDIFPIIMSTIFFGIYGPPQLKLIEEQKAQELNSVLLIGLVLGHVTWNLL